MSVALVRARAAQNPAVFEASWKAQGFSIDQAIENALQRGLAPSVEVLLKDRLRHLHGYREMVAMLRVFGPELAGQVLELSLYPAPLATAAKDLGDHFDVEPSWVSLDGFRRAQEHALPKADTIVVQGVHRLAEGALTGALRATRNAIKRGGRVFVSHRVEYNQPTGFEDALKQLGLAVEEAGHLEFDVRDSATLKDAGVRKGDLRRVALKMAGTARVLVLRPARVFDAHTAIPRLRPSQRKLSASMRRREPTQVDVPVKAQRALATRFVTSMTGSARLKPFMVNVVSGNKLVAVLAHGVNPGRPKAEFVTYPNAPVGEEWREYLQRLLGDAEARERLGVMAWGTFACR